MISRGTNPTITLKVGNQMPIADLEDLELVLAQNNYMLVKYLKDMVAIDEEKNICVFDMTLEEANSFEARKSIKYQVRFKLKNGKYIPSKIKTMMISEVIKDGDF